MSTWLLIVTALIYVGVAGDQFYKREYGMAGVYLGYAFSNVAFLFVVK